MIVLIVDVDILETIGGGQTVYRNLINRSSDVEFFYLSSGSCQGAPLPEGVRAIPLSDWYAPRGAASLDPFFKVFLACMNIARSVVEALGSGVTLDVVDTPDYRQNGLFIRYALEAHGIKVGVVALALHGTLSSAYVSAWPWAGDAGRRLAELHLLERLQYRVADARYALSEAYVEHLDRRAVLPVNRLDPKAAIQPFRPTRTASTSQRPDLAFIGRKERRKGPDLLLDMVWWAPPGAFGAVRLIGPAGENHQGGGGEGVVAEIAHRRGVTYSDETGLSQADLAALYRTRTIVVAPSRYDQFNLTALEALLAGCPTVISAHAGVARFVLDHLPAASGFIQAFACDRTAALMMSRVAADYDRVRDQLVDDLLAADLQVDLASVAGVYEPGGGDREMTGRLRNLAERLHRSGSLARAPTPGAGRAAAPVLRARATLSRGAGVLVKAGRHPDLIPLRLSQRALLQRTPLRGRDLHEFHMLQVRPKVGPSSGKASGPTSYDGAASRRELHTRVERRRVGRVRWFRELAGWERGRGDDLVAAAYELRVIRALGRDTFGALPGVLATLRNGGHEREAEVAEAMYAEPACTERRSGALLEAQYSRLRSRTAPSFELCDDRRAGAAPKVSIIVSLYEAASKLETFLRMIGHQTLMRAGAAEVVLIDSGSPEDEHRVFDAVYRQASFSAVFARSRYRETIQAAWNRGVDLARGDYLCMLGVDEGLRPDALELLCAALDRTPGLDWAMADAIVTEVDRRGVFARDLMTYDRTGMSKSSIYLDSTYLSYVGGLYRRDLHDRHGWYDETFRAAGDTEFKNRVAPHIAVLHVPERLGVFNNYPEARVTQNVRAELEDLRAWYLHRTSAGMAYAFGQAPLQAPVALLGDTLGYRKCHTTHRSSDLDLARSLAAFLQGRGLPEAAAVLKPLEAAISVLEAFELWTGPDVGLASQRWFVASIREARSALGRAVDVLHLSDRSWEVFADNRFEQHAWSWSG